MPNAAPVPLVRGVSTPLTVFSAPVATVVALSDVACRALEKAQEAGLGNGFCHRRNDSLARVRYGADDRPNGITRLTNWFCHDIPKRPKNPGGMSLFFLKLFYNTHTHTHTQRAAAGTAAFGPVPEGYVQPQMGFKQSNFERYPQQRVQGDHAARRSGVSEQTSLGAVYSIWGKNR